MKKGFLPLVLFAANVLTMHHIVDLTIAYDTANFTGYPARAMTIDHQIPAPTLRFKDGDTVKINIHSHLDKEVAIH